MVLESSVAGGVTLDASDFFSSDMSVSCGRVVGGAGSLLLSAGSLVGVPDSELASACCAGSERPRRPKLVGVVIGVGGSAVFSVSTVSDAGAGGVGRSLCLPLRPKLDGLGTSDSDGGGVASALGLSATGPGSLGTSGFCAAVLRPNDGFSGGADSGWLSTAACDSVVGMAGGSACAACGAGRSAGVDCLGGSTGFCGWSVVGACSTL